MKIAAARTLELVSSEPAGSAGPHRTEPGQSSGLQARRLVLVKRRATDAAPQRGLFLDAPWTERDCVALALVGCNRCFGSGCHAGRSPGRLKVCNCVLRAIFRACLHKWRDIAASQVAARVGSLASSSIGCRQSTRRAVHWARPGEEYRADFELIARRTLDARHYAIFRLHFLDGLDWRACCDRLQMDRGKFFHAVYRVEQQLGKAYREAQPYALFPVYEYFRAAA